MRTKTCRQSFARRRGLRVGYIVCRVIKTICTDAWRLAGDPRHANTHTRTHNVQWAGKLVSYDDDDDDDNDDDAEPHCRR